MILPREYYLEHDVLFLAKDLLGKVIRTAIGGVVCAAWIVETEAYRAPEDRASHAYGNRRTPRTERMFGPGGFAYVYLNYGIHHLFNVVTGPQEVAHAVLLRAIFPKENVMPQYERRNRKLQEAIDPKLFDGPGKAAQAMGIRTSHDGVDLCRADSVITLHDAGAIIPDQMILKRPRIGIDYAGEWKEKPWRFTVKDLSCLITHPQA